MYSVKEIYYTLQGEGIHAGRPAIFLRFSGCNLWTGREEDRHKAICQFCDTNFWGTDGHLGGKYEAEALVQVLDDLWAPSDPQYKYVVCTGGEPALQLDSNLIKALKASDWYIAIETNGTIALADGIDWICMSPKANTDILVTKGNEVKVVYPQAQDPKQFESMDFDHFLLQPMDGPDQEVNTFKAVAFCKENPKWRLSIQGHKYIGIE